MSPSLPLPERKAAANTAIILWNYLVISEYFLSIQGQSLCLPLSGLVSDSFHKQFLSHMIYKKFPTSLHTHKASLSFTTRHPYVLGGVGDDYDKKFNYKYFLKNKF